MSDITAGEILSAAKNRVSSISDDVLPVTVAFADPEKIIIGISIQRDYPLTMIERNYGIPFGRLRDDPRRFLIDPAALHKLKTSIEIHETVFQHTEMIEEFVREESRRSEHPESRIIMALSTGIGNVLQNLRSVAYVDKTLYHVVGECPDHPPPYACLVEYSPGASMQENRMGVELLSFTQHGGCHRIDKNEYMRHPAQAESKAEPGFENQIQWAVSGYPLILGGRQVSQEMTAENVSDYRHLWQLPILRKSLVQPLASVSQLSDEQKKKIEFYFGFEKIREDQYFVPATHDEAITMPIDLTTAADRFEIICNVCKIDEDALCKFPIFDAVNHQLKLSPDELADDFRKSGYNDEGKKSKDDVNNPGDFFIDRGRREITVKLLPGIYPHHIVGITRSGKVVNISISGRSGRSGITMGNAKVLCEELNLSDALILDNGFDVITRIGGGAVICHADNLRQTRLTAALHFGYRLDNPRAFGGSFDGFEVAFSTYKVKPVKVA